MKHGPVRLRLHEFESEVMDRTLGSVELALASDIFRALPIRALPQRPVRTVVANRLDPQ